MIDFDDIPYFQVRKIFWTQDYLFLCCRRERMNHVWNDTLSISLPLKFFWWAMSLKSFILIDTNEADELFTTRMSRWLRQRKGRDECSCTSRQLVHLLLINKFVCPLAVNKIIIALHLTTFIHNYDCKNETKTKQKQIIDFDEKLGRQWNSEKNVQK